jgi:hypothetical protein
MLTPTQVGEEISYAQTYRRYLDMLSGLYERPDTVTATNRGDVSATLVHIYTGGASPELEQALERYIQEAAGALPRFDGEVAVVVDTSASTKGYGGREFCIIAQSVALQRVLERNCARLKVYLVGGSVVGDLPMPEGATDLAEGLLDALEGKPDLVAILSDGYENIYAGDLARVRATLPQVGVQTPVAFCHSKFSHSDDLTFRRPTTNMPELEFWHQHDFEGLMLRLFALCGEKGDKAAREFLSGKLDKLERELAPWTTRN